MDEILKYKIQAETDGMVKGFDEAKKELAQLTKQSATLEKQIKSSSAATKDYEKQIENLNKAYKDGNISQKRFETQLAKVNKQEKQAVTETKKLESELKNLKLRQNELSSAVPKLATQNDKLTKSTANAIPVTQEFSRVIQDAPFGILGVGNNITQLVSNFDNLKRSAGGTKQALSAVLSSFAGPGGFLFVISTAVTLLTVYGDKLKLTASLSSELAKKTKEGISSAQSEISTLQSLLSVANDETKSKKARLVALDRINEKYGDYLGNLKLEELGTARVKTAVDNLTRSLIKQAQVRGAQDLIEEKSKDTAEDIANALSDQTQKSIQLQDEIKRLGKDYVELSKIDYSKPLNKQVIEASRIINERLGGKKGGVGDTLEFLTKGFNEAGAEVKELQAETERSLAPLQQLINQLTFEDILLETKGVGKGEVELEVTVTAEEQKKRDAKIAKIRDDIQKELDKITADLDLVDADKQAELARDVEKIFVDSGAAAKSALDDLNGSELDLGVFEEEQKIIALEKRLQALKKTVDANTFNLLQGLSLEELDAFEAKIKQFGEEAKIFSNATAAAIGAVGSSLAKSIQTDSEVLDAFIGSILQSVTQLLSELAANAIKNIAIKQAEATAGAVVAGTSTAAASGPAAAFLLPGLIAGSIGAVVAAFSGLKFASGGIVPGGFGVGDSVPALLTSGEMVLNGNQQSQLFDMLDSRMKGSTADPYANINFEAVLRGADIYLSTKRQERQNNRFNK